MASFPNFTNEKHQKEFEQNGYFVISLFNSDDCNQLIENYNQCSSKEIKDGFYTTIKESDERKKAEVSNLICKKIEACLPKFCHNSHPLFGNFIIKPPKSNYKVGIHQDWSYVDEKKFSSFNVWIALADTHPENGGLIVLPGSHSISMPLRYTPFDEDRFKYLKTLIRLKSKKLDVKKGDAVVYSPSLIHFSDANKTNEIRYACGAVCVPDGAQPKHYFRKGNIIYEYDVEGNFFNSFMPGSEPNMIPAGKSEVSKMNRFNMLFSLLKL